MSKRSPREARQRLEKQMRDGGVPRKDAEKRARAIAKRAMHRMAEQGRTYKKD